MDGSILEEKSSCKILRISWVPYIVSITKTTSKKNGTLICSVNFLPSGSAIYVFHCTIWPCIGYFCHILAFTPNCYLGISDELQKWTCGNASPSLTASLIPLAHCQNVARLILFNRYYFVRCYLNWLNWFHFLISMAGALNILISCMIFLYYSQMLEGYICQQFVCLSS